MTTIHHGLNANLGGVGSGSADKTQATQGQTAQIQTQAQPGSSSQPGEVAITSTAQRLATLEQKISGTPDVNQSRIDSISQALSNGTYKFSASRTADGLLAAQKFDAQASNGVSGSQASTVKAFATTAQLGAHKPD